MDQQKGKPTNADHRSLRILVIDDNRDASESMGTLLSLFGHAVRAAHDARSGLALAASFQPHLIFSDIGLPDMDGYRLAPALRQLSEGRKVVIAAITGYGMENDRKRSLAAGFDHHMVKPIEADTLLDFIARQAQDH